MPRRIVYGLTLALCLALLGSCNRSEPKPTLTPAQEKMAELLLNGSIQHCEQVLDRELTARELKCIQIEFENNWPAMTMSSPLLETYQKRLAELKVETDNKKDQDLN